MLNLQFIESDTSSTRTNGAVPTMRAQCAATTRDDGKIRRRFWRFGLALALLMTILLPGRWMEQARSTDNKLPFGHDLLPSYTAGALIRQGNALGMYHRAAMETFEAHTIDSAKLGMEKRYGAWLNPPFFAWLFVPFSMLPYRTALWTFAGLNLILLCCSIVILRKMLVLDARQSLPISAQQSIPIAMWGLIPLLLVVAYPTIQATGHQQNTFISLLLLCGSVALARRGTTFGAGLVAGLLFFKPQLAVVVAAALAVLFGWRALAGMALTGLALLLVTLITLPGCLSEFRSQLPLIIHYLQQEAPYHWGRQVTLQSFWRILIQGHEPAETLPIVRLLTGACLAGFLAALAGAVIRNFKSPRGANERDRLLSAAIVTMPLVMPYYMDYDLVLLAVPAVLLAREWVTSGAKQRSRSDRWLLAAWVMFYVATFANPALAEQTRINLTVVALAAVAGLSIARCYNAGPCRYPMQTANI